MRVSELDNSKVEKSLKDEIVSELTYEEKSISGLQKRLEQKGKNTHRLVLTGYLDALVDVGILSEREIKPSRIYSVRSVSGDDIYNKVGIVARMVSDGNAADNALELLHFLFNRPIFVREIERCNVDLPREYRAVLPLRRSEYIAKLNEQGINVPQSNVMMEPKGRDVSRLMKMMRDLIFVSLNLGRYVMPDQEGTQTTLD